MRRAKEAYRILVEGGVNSSMSLNFLACTDQSAHTPTAYQCTLERLEPVRIRASWLVVVCTKSLESLDDQIICATFIPIDNKDQHVENELSGGYVGGIETTGDLGDEAGV